MKYKLNQAIHYTFLVGCIMLGLNCNNGCDTIQTIYLKDLNKYVPYTGNDTLRFLHNNTDTQVFIGQGLERFFVREGKEEDGDCEKDHESVRIRFRNTTTQDEIRMEYLFDVMNFSGYIGVNNMTFYNFYYRNEHFGNKKSFIYPSSTITINENEYHTSGLFIFSHSFDTVRYIMFRRQIDENYGGLLKIKYPGDTLTLLR